jgi:metallophosphoesterase (TIGR00282 family)
MTSNDAFRILFLGDVVGRPGRAALKARTRDLKKLYRVDVVIANGENAAGGVGTDPSTAREILDAGVDVITGGNHTFSRRELIPTLSAPNSKVIRPANFPKAPGRGFFVLEHECGVAVGVLNLIGRVFMDLLVDCPFRVADELLQSELAQCDVVLVDFHGEATSEKLACAHYLDGRVTAVVGTHTHVQTADERVLPNGTACITDVGMCGPYDSILGVGTDAVVQRFVTGRPHRFEVAPGRSCISGVIIESRPGESRRATSIERIFEVE